MYLQVDEVLLLENLTYLVDATPFQSILNYEGYTVGELIDSIDTERIHDDRNYGSYLTGIDWKRLFKAIKKNPDLPGMFITSPHLDDEPGAGGGISTLFINPEKQEIVVAFRGTGPNEWIDDFIAGSQTDTPQQLNALSWYRDTVFDKDCANWYITVTGHSKGGNKAKYITIMDDTVNRCLSFDGQGFSDDFFMTYADRIKNRHTLIENHNVDYDYVNILLNDIGGCYFYEGFDIGKGSFFENHCPNTYFDFDDDGNYKMMLSDRGQSPEMQELDYFLNSLIRSMDKQNQHESLLLIGSLVEGGFAMSHKKSSLDEYMNFFTELILDERFTDDVAYLIAYIIRYNQRDPRLMSALKMILEKFNMTGFLKTINIFEDILEWRRFDTAFHLLKNLTAVLPDVIIRKLTIRINKKYQIEMTDTQMKIILSLLGMIHEDMHKIVLTDNGDDLTVEDL